jgi:hypothetical protein
LAVVVTIVFEVDFIDGARFAAAVEQMPLRVGRVDFMIIIIPTKFVAV